MPIKKGTYQKLFVSVILASSFHLGPWTHKFVLFCVAVFIGDLVCPDHKVFFQSPGDYKN